MEVKMAFENEKYIKEQTSEILERVKNFGNKLLKFRTIKALIVREKVSS